MFALRETVMQRLFNEDLTMTRLLITLLGEIDLRGVLRMILSQGIKDLIMLIIALQI